MKRCITAWHAGSLAGMAGRPWVAGSRERAPTRQAQRPPVGHEPHRPAPAAVPPTRWPAARGAHQAARQRAACGNGETGAGGGRPRHRRPLHAPRVGACRTAGCPPHCHRVASHRRCRRPSPCMCSRPRLRCPSRHHHRAAHQGPRVVVGHQFRATPAPGCYPAKSLRTLSHRTLGQKTRRPADHCCSVQRDRRGYRCRRCHGPGEPCRRRVPICPGCPYQAARQKAGRQQAGMTEAEQLRTAESWTAQKRCPTAGRRDRPEPYRRCRQAPLQRSCEIQ